MDESMELRSWATATLWIGEQDSVLERNATRFAETNLLQMIRMCKVPKTLVSELR